MKVNVSTSFPPLQRATEPEKLVGNVGNASAAAAPRARIARASFPAQAPGPCGPAKREMSCHMQRQPGFVGEN